MDNKLELLKQIMIEEGKYNEQEINWVLKNVSINWLCTEQNKEEIRKQINLGYGIWKVLAN